MTLSELQTRIQTLQASCTVKVFAKDAEEARELALEEADFLSACVDDSWIDSIRKLPNPYQPKPLPPEVQPRLFNEAS